MRQPANSSLRSFVWLLSSAIAACSGVGQDGLVTVGVRPSYGVAASGGAGGLPLPGRDVMNRLLVDNDTTTRSRAAAGASGASAGTFASAGSGTKAEGSGGT